MNYTGWKISLPFCAFLIAVGITIVYNAMAPHRSHHLAPPYKVSNVLKTSLRARKPYVCISKPECINKKFPVVQMLKKRTLKPLRKQRTIYLQTRGRFGNVLYQLAALLALARATCTTVKLSTGYNLQDIFEDFPFEVIPADEFNRRVKGLPDFNLMKNPGKANEAIETALRQDIRITHVFFSFTWCEGCKEYIRHNLRLKERYTTKAKKIINDLILQSGQRNATTVSVHIRRGDRASKKLFKLGYRVPTVTYFDKAMSYFKNKYKNVIFIITTDDRKWVTENFPNKTYPNVSLAPKNAFEIDFAVLISCDYVIQSVGSFSRWVGFLNGHESIHYKFSLACEPPRCDPNRYQSSHSPFQSHWISMEN